MRTLENTCYLFNQWLSKRQSGLSYPFGHDGKTSRQDGKRCINRPPPPSSPLPAPEKAYSPSKDRNAYDHSALPISYLHLFRKSNAPAQLRPDQSHSGRDRWKDQSPREYQQVWSRKPHP